MIERQFADEEINYCKLMYDEAKERNKKLFEENKQLKEILKNIVFCTNLNIEENTASICVNINPEYYQLIHDILFEKK